MASLLLENLETIEDIELYFLLQCFLVISKLDVTDSKCLVESRTSGFLFVE